MKREPRSPPHITRLTTSVPKAGSLIGLGKSSSYEAVRRGDIPAIRIGKRLLVVIAGLEDKLGLERGALDFLREEAESDEDDDHPPEPRRSASEVLLVSLAFPAPLQRRLKPPLLFIFYGHTRRTSHE